MSKLGVNLGDFRRFCSFYSNIFTSKYFIASFFIEVLMVTFFIEIE